MSESNVHPLRKQTGEVVPPSFSFPVTNILCKGHVYEITGACRKRREQLGLVLVTRDSGAVEAIQKISGSTSAEELVLHKETKLLKDIDQIERVWYTLSEMCTAVLKKGMDLGDNPSSLSSIKTLINLYTDHIRGNHCCTGEIGARIRNEMRALEDKLVVEIAEKLGTEYATEWSAKMMSAWKTK